MVSCSGLRNHSKRNTGHFKQSLLDLKQGYLVSAGHYGKGVTGGASGSNASRKESEMQTTNVRQIKAALVDQAFPGTAQVSCPLGQVVAVSKWKGQLRVMIREWGRW
jgi:hypothetical protein